MYTEEQIALLEKVEALQKEKNLLRMGLHNLSAYQKQLFHKQEVENLKIQKVFLTHL